MLCLAVYRNPRLRSTTNLYIIALSVGDLICAVLEMPLTFWTLVVGKWVFGDGVCQLHGFVDVFSTYCPPATIGLTAFNRYIRIVKTNHYRQIFPPWRSKFWLFSVWFSLAGYLLIARVTTRNELAKIRLCCRFCRVQCGALHRKQETYSLLLCGLVILWRSIFGCNIPLLESVSGN